MSEPIAVIAGLGNPGQKYAETRHNAGFLFVDRIAQAYAGTFRSSKYSGEVAEVTVAGGRLLLLKPTTYMNHSGRSIAALANYYKYLPQQILVAHDELDLPPGVARIKQGGGHGGHNGLRDTVANLGSKDFIRLRIGIGHPGNSRDVVDYVLNRSSKADQALIEEAIEDSLAVLPDVLAGNFSPAMNTLHSRK